MICYEELTRTFAEVPLASPPKAVTRLLPLQGADVQSRMYEVHLRTKPDRYPKCCSSSQPLPPYEDARLI